MSARKVLFVSNLYGRRARGGAERIVEMEAEALTRAGAKAVVVTATPDAPEDFTDGGVRVREVRPFNLCFYDDLHGRSLAFRFVWHLLDMVDVVSARAVRAVLADVRPDVVHTHNLMGIGFLTPRTVRRAGIRHVHTVHDVQLLHPSGLLPPSYRKARGPIEGVYVALMRLLMGSPDVVIFPSEKLMALHDANGFFRRSKRMVVRNPAPPLADERVAPTAPHFAFIGQLEPHKGVCTLLKAWEAWEDRGAARLTIAGGGSLLGDRIGRIRRLPNAAFLGRIDRARVLETLAGCSHVVVPSEVIENAPTVLLEAMSQGTPAVAADTGGIPELVREGETGTLFAPCDADALVAAFRRASDLSRWKEMSRASQARAREMSIDAHMTALKEIYG